MFSLPQPSPTAIDNTTAGEIPIIPVTEDAQTLDFMFRTIYPVRSPKIEKLSDLRFVLEASLKYQIETLDGVAEESLMGAIEQDPVSVYALACRSGLNEIASKAAPYTLNRPLSEFSDCLQYISGEDYWRLIKYRHECAVAASAVVKTRSWLSECPKTLLRSGGGSNCRCYVKDAIRCERGFSSSYYWEAPQFLWTFLDRVAVALMKRPSSSAVTGDKSFESLWASVKCNCAGYPYRSNDLNDGMPKFRQLLAAEIDRVIAQVCPPLFDSLPLPSGHQL
ncbi:hypothetical protein EW146_g8560 [Bondarzewia mesenterica]|uniref:BTB domain-containing protein n=1 Tax=Bondarzewia mesenterica TaxID=1095465 RepID=A0A4S4LIY8_9AGAM|nr:hypothetical protein EW146_g8560 [Bondarzewia mesenterica]